MCEFNHKNKIEYVPPVVLELGGAAALTAFGGNVNADSDVPDSAFPNPTDAS
jgi:hypothetical protein